MEVVSICKRKRPRGCGRWAAYVTAIDALGTWAYTPAGSRYTGESGDGAVATCDVAQDGQGRGRHSVVLFPDRQWFVATWVLGSPHVVDVDIATPPLRSNSSWSFDDLELDPYLLADGMYGVDDRDEFDAACAAGLIDIDERGAALRTVDVLHDELSAEISQLRRTGTRRLRQAITLGLPPLTAEADR